MAENRCAASSPATPNDVRCITPTMYATSAIDQTTQTRYVDATGDSTDTLTEIHGA